LGADIAVIPECPAPPTTRRGLSWTGTDRRKGVAVLAKDGWRLRRATRRRLPAFVVPYHVEGPRSFVLLAVWMKGTGPERYVRGLHRAISACEDLIRAHPTVILGDLNSNAIWDAEHPGGRSHSDLVARLDALGLVSAYHHHRGELHGAEREATFFLYRRPAAPYHLDYCFLPRAWLGDLRGVAVGPRAEWLALSDHLPLTCDLAPGPLPQSVALP
ncbi:MAG TPA: endonuclease/exonuclease/phosphatase family protein, partial [Gemmatimonadales bacterium]|nr:endonuclease/exonuclease/phosphatase family protein [Gemmatimonadales bacterium]